VLFCTLKIKSADANGGRPGKYAMTDSEHAKEAS